MLLSLLSLPIAQPGIAGEPVDPPPATQTAPSEEAPPSATPPERSPELHPHGFRQIGLDARYLISRPLHLDSKGKVKLAVTAGTAGVLFLLRNRIRDEAQEHRSASRDQFLQDVRIMGKGAFAPSLAAISYGTSFLTRNDREKETAVLLLESMAFTGAGVGLGQFVLSSQRPDTGKEVRFFRFGGHGFSGDAGLAASVVPVLRHQYLRVGSDDGAALRVWKRGATGFLYTGALLTAYQRVNNDKHWAPDVFLGLVTGLTVGQVLCDSHDATVREKKTHASLTPVPGGVGLTLRF